jgi:hypothetical protein
MKGGCIIPLDDYPRRQPTVVTDISHNITGLVDDTSVNSLNFRGLGSPKQEPGK